MQKVQLYGPKYAIKDRSIKLNCSSDTVPEGNTAEFLINGKSVNNVRLHQSRCFRTVDVIECVPGVCQCSDDGRTFVFYYIPNETGECNFSCRMKFSSNMSSEAGQFGTYNIVTNVIEPTPLIKTEKYDYLINLTCSVIFIDITTVFTWSCDNEPIMSESLHNTSTLWSVVSLELSLKKSTSLCFCNVSLPIFNFTGSTTARLEYRDTSPHESLFCNISTPIKLTCGNLATQDSNAYWRHQINSTFIRSIPSNDPKLRWNLFIKSCTLQDIGRPELLQNEVVYLRNDVVFSLTFYSSEESNIITWYRQWIRLVNSTKQVQTTKPTTLHFLVRGKNVSVNGFQSNLVLGNAKEHHLYNIKICVKNKYGISCYRYLESEGSSIPTENTTNPVYQLVDTQQANQYQHFSADRDEQHTYEIPNAVYEELNEDRPSHDYSTASQYEEVHSSTTETNSIENRDSYEKVADIELVYLCQTYAILFVEIEI
ncbi:unnamed protein product [Mytilus coruscus]|uniref:Ig-like domain-containing protein n=1 Tax=Mytilus coruscus TaxID=42192 RepID=A0A6J8DRV5_MYTCO|nr:unnamed protein product [Mytilus coruscus]